MRQDAKADIGELAQPLYTTTSKSQRKWGYRKDRVRGRNVWDSQFLDTIFTVVTLAIVDLFFAVSKVARRGCTSGTWSTLFLQLGEDLEKNTKRDPDGVGQLILTSYSATRSVDIATSPLPLPQTPHRYRRTDTRREVKRTK